MRVENTNIAVQPGRGELPLVRDAFNAAVEQELLAEGHFADSRYSFQDGPPGTQSFSDGPPSPSGASEAQA